MPKRLKMPVGKWFEIRSDLAGRTLTGSRACSLISANLPIAPLQSRFVTLRQAEDRLKEAEKDKTKSLSEKSIMACCKSYKGL